MCITVNSKHNVIRKMFSVIKYLVLVFAFVYISLFAVCNKINAWTFDYKGVKKASSSVTGTSGMFPTFSVSEETSDDYDFFQINITIKNKTAGLNKAGYSSYEAIIIDVSDGTKWLGDKTIYKDAKDTGVIKLRIFRDGGIYHCTNDNCPSYNGSNKEEKGWAKAKDSLNLWSYLNTSSKADGWYKKDGFTLNIKIATYDGWQSHTYPRGGGTTTYDIDADRIEIKKKIYLWQPNISFEDAGGYYDDTSTVKISSESGIKRIHYLWTKPNLGINAVDAMAKPAYYYVDKNSNGKYDSGEIKYPVTEYLSSSTQETSKSFDMTYSEDNYAGDIQLRVCVINLWDQLECTQRNTKVDNVDPVITASNSSEWKQSHVITGTITDVGAGLDTVTYCLKSGDTCVDSGNLVLGTGGTFTYNTPSNLEGSYILKIEAKDKLGNSDSKELTCNTDDKAPRISLTTTDGTDLTTTWSKKNITLTVEDANIKSDGCSYIWKDSSGTAIKGGSGNCTISDNYIVIAPPSNQERELSLTVTVTDSVGNPTEPTTYSGLKIDNYAPRIVSSKLTPIGSTSSKAAQNWKITVVIEDRELKDGIVNNLVCLKMSTQGKTCTERATANSYRMLTELGPEGKNMLNHVENRYTLEFDTSKFTGKLDKLNGTYYLVVKVTDNVNATVAQSTDQMVFDNTKPGIIEATKTKYSMTTDGTLINVENPIIGGFNVMTKMQIMDATSLSEIVTSNGSNNGYIADFENKFYIKVIGIKGKTEKTIDEGYNLLKTTEYKMIKENGNYYLMIIIGLCNRAETPTCYSVDSKKYDSLKVEVYIREDIVTDTAGNSLNLTTSSKFGKDPNKYYELMTVELRLGSKNNFTVQTVAKQETNNNNNQNEGKKSTQVTTLSSVVEREEILVEEIREANVKEVVIPLEETNMVIQVDETLVEITVEEVEEKETEKEIVVVVDENTEIVVINYGSMSYEYKVKEITSNLNSEVILHELMVSNKRVLVKLKSMKEH